ncbi:MAG: Calx-beta domain-containing protein, partial [Pirellula sp.]
MPAPNVPEIETNPPVPGPVSLGSIEDFLDPWYPTFAGDDLYEDGISMNGKSVFVGGGDANSSWTIGSNIAILPEGIYPSIVGPVDLNSDSTILASDNSSGLFYGPNMLGGFGSSMATPGGPDNPNPNPLGAVISLHLDMWAREGESPYFLVRSSYPLDRAVTVSMAYTPSSWGGAIFGTDYTAPTSITLSPFTTSQMVPVRFLSDATTEGTEYFTVRITGLNVPASVATHETYAIGGTIIDVPPVGDPNSMVRIISIEDVIGTEGLNNSLTFRVTASNPKPNNPVLTIPFRTNDGTARVTQSPVADYSFANGSITFAPTQTEAFITIPIHDDSVVESDEYFFVDLTLSGNARAGRSRGWGTIKDNDGPVNIFVSDAPMVLEGQTSMFRVWVDNPVRTVAGTFRTFSGSATQNQDYLGVDIPFTIPAGTREITIPVQTLVNNNPPESQIEHFFGRLSSVTGASLGDSEGMATIEESSSPVTAYFWSSTREGDTAPNFLHTVFEIPQNFSQPVSVTFHTEDRTAFAWSDYVPITPSRTITFIPGVNQPGTNTPFQAIVSIATVPDLIQETPAQETFAFVIDSVSNGYLANASQQTTMTIIDDDNVPTLTVDGGTVYEGHLVPFVFKLNAMPPGGFATVTYQTQDGTAKDGIGEPFDERDYIPINPASTITLTQLTTTISIESINDARVESDENFKLLISAPSLRVATPTATGTILDNDSVVKLRIADATQIEGNQGYSPAELMKFAVSATVEGKQITNLIGVNLTTETVDQFIDGFPNPKYATPIADFQPTGHTNGSFTFPIGQSRNFEVPIFGDLVPESNEEFRGRILSAGVIGTIPNGGQATIVIERERALGTIIDDDILQAQELKFDFERVLDEEQNCVCVASDGPDGTLVSSKESALTISPDGIIEYRKGGTHSTTQLQSFVITRDPNTVIPNTYKTTVTVGGHTFTPVAFAGTAGDQDGKIAFSIPLDLKQFSTGFYEGEVKITATKGTQGASGWQYTVKRKFQFRVVNNDNSEMPSDWWNPAVERLYPMKYFGQGNVSNPDWSKGAMYVRGDQTAWLFLGPNYAQPDGLISTLVRNTNGTFTLSDKFGGVKTFSNLGLMLSSADRNANTSTYSYIDANSDFFPGELSTIVDPLGRTTTYTYSGGKLIRVTDFAGRMTEYTVQNNKLTKITLPDPDLSGPRPAPYYDLSYSTFVASSWIQLIDADGAINIYTFDRFGKVTRVDDDYGGTWTYNYIKNRGIIVVLANGSSSGVAAMPGELEMKVTNPRQKLTKIKTDRFGLPISIVYADGASESFTRNKHGSPLVRQYPSPAGGTNTTLYSYDTLQNPTSIADPSVGVLNQTFGQHSLPVSIDQTGLPFRYIQRDYNGNPTAIYTYQSSSAHGIAANITNSLSSTSYQNNPIDRFDVNNDGFVNASDVSTLDSFIANPTTSFPGGVTRNGRVLYPDVNGNGSVNSSDSLALQMYLNSLSSFTYLTDTFSYIGTASGVLNGTLATHTDPANQFTSYEYYSTGSSRGLLKSIRRQTPTGNVILGTYDYDPFLNIKSVTDLYGVITNYTYDRLDLLTQFEGAAPISGTGPITSYQYSTMGHLTRITDPASQVTNIFRRANGQPYAVTEQATGGGSNRTTTLSTDNMGNVITVNEPGGIITEYVYDSRERVSEVKLPALNANTTHKIQYTYNQAGYLTGVQDPFGSLTLITYAASGDQSIVKQIDPQNSANVSESKVFYSAPGLVSSTQSPTGDLSHYLRDGYSNLVAIDYPASNLGTYVSRPRITFAYDSKMDQVAATDLNGQAQINRYDSLGRLTSIVTSDPDGIGPAGRSTTQFGAKTRSNGLHNQTVTLPDGRALTYTSDSRDRLTRIDMPSLNGTGTVFAAFQYDILDRLTSERNFAGAFTEYVYNRFDEVTSVRGPNPVTGAADPNFATTFSYDNLGRNTSVTAPNGATTNF